MTYYIYIEILLVFMLVTPLPPHTNFCRISARIDIEPADSSPGSADSRSEIGLLLPSTLWKLAKSTLYNSGRGWGHEN